MNEEAKKTENAMPLFEASITAPSRNISEEKRDAIKQKLDLADEATSQMDLIKERLREDEKKGNGSAKQLLKYIEGLEDIKRELRNSIYATKYGLVFEEHCEEIDDKLKTHVPVLTEKEELILPKKGDKEGTVNFLIEGDNLASLQLLKRTHTGKIDLIYIDPPYNTKNKEFVYGDTRIGETDLFRHSKWLSFMSKRLEIAKELLSERGVIFMSIDDNEQAQLKLLCDGVFGEENFIANCFVLDNLKGKTGDHFITSVGSRLYVYCKNMSAISEKGFNDIENIFSKDVATTYKWEDEVGPYKISSFKKTGSDKLREKRHGMYYPILQKDGLLYAITQEEFEKIYDENTKTFNDGFLQALIAKYEKEGYKILLPLDSNGVHLRWTSSYLTFVEKMNGDIFYDNGSVKQKVRPKANEMLQIYASGTPKSLFYKASYSRGTNDFKAVMGNSADFSFPKPVSLLMDILKLPKFSNDKSITILDFFAGSGTTGEAVMRLNREDGGRRRFILCTNNEGGEVREEDGICRKITYERLKNVIKGEYKGVNKDKVKKKDKYKYEPYNVTLKYFQVDFVPNTYPREDPKPRLRSKRKFYLEYANELLKHVRELLELEKAINFKENEEIAIILTKEDLNKFMEKLKKTPACKCKTVYLSYKIFLSGANYKLLVEKGITDEHINRIPDYYHRELSK